VTACNIVDPGGLANSAAAWRATTRRATNPTDNVRVSVWDSNGAAADQYFSIQVDC
jgi:hypothetical protein